MWVDALPWAQQIKRVANTGFPEITQAGRLLVGRFLRLA